MRSECPVCLEQCDQPDKLPCNHTVCRLCLRQMAHHKITTCPLCRAPLLAEPKRGRRRRRDVTESEFRERRLRHRRRKKPCNRLRKQARWDKLHCWQP